MRSFISQYGRLIIGRGGSALLQAATLVALARLSSIKDFGIYATGVALGAICIGVFGAGLPTLVLRTEARDSTGLAGSALMIGALGAGATGGVVAVVLALIVPAAPGSIITAAAIFAASELWLNLVQNVLLGTQQEKLATWIIVLRRAVPLAVLLLAASVSWSSYEGFFLGSILISLGSLLAVWRFRRRVTTLRNLWTLARHFWLANIASMFQQLDVIFIRQGIGNGPAAAYAAAFRLASPIHIVTTAITAKLVPALAAEDDMAHRTVRQRKYMLTGVAYSVLVLVASPAAGIIGPVLLGAQYEEYHWVFVLTLVNSAFSVLNQIQAAILYAYGRARVVARATIISVVLGLALVVVGAAIGSLIIAVAGTISIQVILVICLAVLLRKGNR
ncbi:lipopolysaccharide biosynthesis protein [Curtobacterium sp. 20TX0008]|uniref:lipopolysaccharide biosynthesis protein n=1 Tax=Curtobacterium sp. 20TX0008 TaxID=3022018 RepID=UPI0023310E89|nr:hypothetical protein [Curtobacterium sp. 20TX0008]MDB6427905.1 hypothetical protein [Curtobacterium sp. 20TX0008]